MTLSDKFIFKQFFGIYTIYHLLKANANLHTNKYAFLLYYFV